MSRRHKDYPTISTQEIRQVAEDTSKKAIKRAIKKAGIMDASYHSVFKHTMVSIESRKKIDDELNAAITEVSNTLANEIEVELTKKLEDILKIVDAPTQEPPPPKKRERPTILFLFERFKDYDVINMLRGIYQEQYHSAIEKAQNIVDHLVSFFLAMCSMEEKDSYGLVKHYWRVLKKYITGVKICSERTIQRRITEFLSLKKRWRDKKMNLFNRVEKAKFKLWSRLEAMYLEHLRIIAPKYALYAL